MMTASKTLKNACASLAFITVFSPAIAFAQTSPIPQFATFDPASSAVIDYTIIDNFLGAVGVPEKGRYLPSYDIMRAEGHNYLSRYLANLEQIPVSQLNKDEQLAYWLNVHNLLVIQAVTDEKKSSGFKKKRGTPTQPGPSWTKKRVIVEGVELSLHDIEQGILLANWDNPNILYGMYQGFKDAPAMGTMCFSGPTVQESLKQAAQKYVSNTKSVKVKKSSVRVSEFYDWYKSTVFNGDDAELLSHLASYAPEKTKSNLAASSELKFKQLSSSIDNFVVRQQANSAAGSSSGDTYQPSQNNNRSIGRGS